MVAKMIALDKIVGLTDLANRFDISIGAAYNMTTRERSIPFPDPITFVSNKPVWDWDEVVRWDKTRKNPRVQNGRARW